MRSVATDHKPLTATHRASRSAAALLQRCGFPGLCFQRRRGLRIVCYHGVCADEAAGKPWVPAHFVSASTFAKQMAILSRFGPIVHLPDVLHDLTSGRWDLRSCSAVTFDDVTACTFEHARSVLAEFRVRATFFVSTGHATTGRLFNADVIDLLRLHPELIPPDETVRLGQLLRRQADHKLMTLEQLRTTLNDAENILRQNIDPSIVNALRPVNWDEIRALTATGHDIGGHTVDHSILGRQSCRTRSSQIAGCVADIEREIGRRPTGFAYPNGGPGDFQELDYPILQRCGIRYAVSTRAGFCAGGTERYALPRVCIGAGHTPDKFALEVSGLWDRRRQRQQGWR